MVMGGAEVRRGAVVTVLGGAWLCGILSAGAADAQAVMSRADAAKMKNPVARSPASIASGQQLFQKYCRFCHGATGNGVSPMAPKDMKPSNLTDAVWDRGSTDGEIFLVIQEGAGPDFKMKGLKNKITEQDTWNLVNYVRTLGGVTK